MPDEWPVTVLDQIATALTTDVPIGASQRIKTLIKEPPHRSYVVSGQEPVLFIWYDIMGLNRRTTGKDTATVTLRMAVVSSTYTTQETGQDVLGNAVFDLLEALSKNKSNGTYWNLDSGGDEVPVQASFGTLWPDTDHTVFAAEIIWQARASQAKPT